MATKYRCKNCNYVFVPKTERDPSRCPYCAEAQLMEESAYFNLNKELE